MKLAYGMKLKDIIGYLNGLDYVQIIHVDAFFEGSPNENDAEEVYCGPVMGIPWYLLDYYLENSLDGEAIGVFIKDEQAWFEIVVCEEFHRLTAVKESIAADKKGYEF